MAFLYDKKVMLITFCLCLSACSLRVTYPFLDWLVEWEIRDYIKLNKEQKNQLRLDIDQWHAWHRETELPRYRAFTADLGKQMDAGPLAADDIEAINQRIIGFWRSAVLAALPATTRLLGSLSDKQVEKMLATIEKERQKDIKEYLGIELDKYKNRRTKRLLKSMKPMIGALDETQLQILADWQDALKDSRKGSAEARLAWQEAFALALKQRRDTQALEAELKRLMLGEESLWDPDYLSMIQFNRQQTYGMLAQMSATLSSKQTAKRHRYLETFHRDFELLHQASTSK